MAKREWGAKHTCAECGVKFYDLHRRPIACPKCGSLIEIETVRPPSRRRPPAAAPAPTPAASDGADVAVDTADAVAAVDKTDDDDADDVIDETIDEDETLVDDVANASSIRASK